MTRRFGARRIVLLVLATLVFSISLWAVAEYRHQHRPFNREHWLAFDYLARTRTYMVDDLIHRQHLIGKTRPEVLALLGPQSDTGQFSDWDLTYVLGAERGFMGIDSEWLVLRFDDADRVMQYEIVRD